MCNVPFYMVLMPHVQGERGRKSMKAHYRELGKICEEGAHAAGI